ncbi:MAG: hypothetical protein QXR53_04200 [Candidatus Norongarragalinales archaeon]
MVQSVSRAVKETLSNLTYLSFAFEHQLVNESALARFIHKRVEEKTGKPASRGAIIAAVRRFMLYYKPRQKDLNLIRFLKTFKVQIRTGVTELNFKRTPQTSELMLAALKKTAWNKGQKLYTIPRSQEITVVSTNNPEALKTLLSKIPSDAILSKHDDRAIITVSYDPTLGEKTFGALHYLTDIFASLGIAIHVVFSTYSENSFVIKERDVPAVYKALSGSLHEIDELHE